MWTDDFPFLLRLLAAGALAAVLGWEREKARKSAGLRTHILVAVGAAFFVTLADVTSRAAGGTPASVLRLDPIQGVAVGIGFLGTGLIFKSDDRVHGLTTAASIWTTAAVGYACGISHYVLAAGATVILFVVLRVLERFEKAEGTTRKTERS